MQVGVPQPQTTHPSYGVGLPTLAVPGAAIVVAPQYEVGFKPDQQKTMKTLSALQVAIGISCVIIYIALLATNRWFNVYYGYYLDFTGAGIWCGVLYIFAGSLGVAAARQNRLCLIVSAMVMSILSSTCIWIVLGMAAFAIDSSIRNENCMRVIYSGLYTYSYPCNSYNFYGLKAADSILIILSVAELIISIWCSVLCCKGSCKACCRYGNNYGYQPQTTYYVQTPSAGQQVIFTPQAGVEGRHACAFVPAQPPYMEMQHQPVLFTHTTAPGAAPAPPSYHACVAGPQEYPANQTRDVSTAGTSYEQTFEVAKDRMTERY